MKLNFLSLYIMILKNVIKVLCLLPSFSFEFYKDTKSSSYSQTIQQLKYNNLHRLHVYLVTEIYTVQS